MIGKVPQSNVKPVGLGVTTNSSVYGQTIPVVYGTTKSSLYLTWCANVREGASVKKGKGKKSSKAGIKSYVANADCLLGHNPVAAILQLWNNNQARLALNAVTQSASGPASSIAITDSKWFATVGVTAAQAIGETFSDYGAGGTTTFGGTGQAPLWNYAFARPSSRFDPYHLADGSVLGYFWVPQLTGAAVKFPFTSALSGALTIHYAQIVDSGKGSPLAQLRLSFEPVLGDGPEYGSTYASQQIWYPHYAGVGSADFDLGYSGLAPMIQLELMGAYGVVPSTASGFAAADADYVDQIIDIFGQSAVQGAAGDTQAYTQIQHALPCSDWPGVFQRYWASRAAAGSGTLVFGLPNTAGNFLVAAVVSDVTGSSFGVSDTAGNTWTALYSGDAKRQLWYATAAAHAAGNTVTITGAGTDANFGIFEIGGVDTLDTTAIAGATSASITSSGAGGTPNYMLGISLASGAALSDPDTPFWPTVLLTNSLGRMLVQDRVAYQPGTYTLNNAGAGGLGHESIALLAFKCSQAPGYARALGNILDIPSLANTWQQCRAFGLVGSLGMNSQKQASDWLKQLYQCANAAPVWSGFRLKTIPMSEVSWADNGAVYVAPTSAGPVAKLSEDDMIGDSGQPLITIERKAQSDVPNLQQFQHPNRASDYNQVITAQPLSGSIAAYGQRKDSPQVFDCIQETEIANMLLGISVRRANALRNAWKFKLKGRHKRLEPRDLVEVTDNAQGIVSQPLILTTITEDEKYALDCEAEEYHYGLSSPKSAPVNATFAGGSYTGGGYGGGYTPPSATPPNPYAPQTGTTPGPVNAPIFVEATNQLAGGAAQEELWIAVSNADPNHSGCLIYASVDGGTTYALIVNPLTGNAITGVLTAAWATGSDPDTAHDLAVDLTESKGALNAYPIQAEDGFVYPCYVASASGYELMSYAVATLTAAHKYTLKATGAGNHLRRGILGSAIASHTLGARFGFLGADAPGVARINVPAQWAAQTIVFKCVPYNTFSGGFADLSTATAYSYTFASTPAGTNPGVLPVGGFLVNGS